MSTFAKLTRKYGANKEGHTPNYWETTLYLNGNLATGDDQLNYVLKMDAMLVNVQMNLLTNGDTSGATTLSIERASSTTDLTGGALSLAHDSAALYDETDITDSTFLPVRAFAGETYQVCIDAIPGGTTSTGLTVILGFISM